MKNTSLKRKIIYWFYLMRKNGKSYTITRGSSYAECRSTRFLKANIFAFLDGRITTKMQCKVH
jgi:hypothetical protein